VTVTDSKCIILRLNTSNEEKFLYCKLTIDARKEGAGKRGIKGRGDADVKGGQSGINEKTQTNNGTRKTERAN